MKSNTELSKLIADKLGIKEDVGVRDFSFDMNGAWVLVEAMLAGAWYYDIGYKHGHFARFYIGASVFEVEHEHMPTDILRAAALALGVKI